MAHKEELDQLAALPIFLGLAPGELSELVSLGTRVDLAEGQVLFADAGPADGLLVLLSGGMDVYIASPNGGNVLLAHLDPGAVLGEIGLFIGGSGPAFAQATERSVVLCYPYDRFRELIRADSLAAHRVVHNLAQMLAARLRAAEDLLAQLCGGETPPQMAEDDLHRLRKIFFVDWAT